MRAGRSSTIKLRVRGRLFDHRYKPGLGDSQIRGHQPEAVNPRCSGNRPVGGVSQSSQGRDLQCYFISQRENAKYRVGIQFLKELVERRLQEWFLSAGENGDLQKADCAQSHRFAPAHRRFQHSRLCPGKLPVVGQPSNEYVCIQQYARQQVAAPYACRTTSQRADISAFTMSPVTRTRPAQLLRGDFQAARFTGPRTATGRPRLVIVMGSPDFSISLRHARHLALKSVALNTRSFICSS
jgi:hypothetical protein